MSVVLGTFEKCLQMMFGYQNGRISHFVLKFDLFCVVLMCDVFNVHRLFRDV